MYVSNSIPESYFKAIAVTNYGTYPVPKGSKGHAQSGLFEESLIKELSAKDWGTKRNPVVLCCQHQETNHPEARRSKDAEDCWNQRG